MPGGQYVGDSARGGLNIIGTGDGVSSGSTPSEDGLQGSSSSSSSSIYQHPFASFNFGPSTPSDASHTLSSRLKDASISPKASFTNKTQGGLDYTASNLNAPPSPTTSFAGSQQSIEDYDTDSPNSLCSWSSFMSGHKGDLGDVEDLELGEPELETVSELDEENFSANGSDGPVLESDDDLIGCQPTEGLRFGESLNRRRTITQHGGASHHHHLHNHLVGQSAHGLPHFSPRSGGHGLSHHSRWTSRTPASVVARRRKGRIAELAEEDAGDAVTSNVGINTTKMPSRGATEMSAFNPPSSTKPDKSPLLSRSGDGAGYLSTPLSSQWSEFAGPPALPVRSVSPSETVPVVPSPLCEFISASMTEAGEAILPPPPTTTDGKVEDAAKVSFCTEGPDLTDSQDHLTTPTASRILDGKQSDLSTGLAAPVAMRCPFDFATASDPAHTYDTFAPDSASSTSLTKDSIESAEKSRRVSPEITQPTSPTQPLARKGSSRTRRSSSPVRMTNKAKVPLRPCFSRRNSTQSGRSTRESSIERDRGRCHVRFSPAPPQTIRTHSPIEYDRSPCAVHNRLSIEDVQELHNMEMDMGLLSAKCSAIAAITSCKLPKKHSDSLPSSVSSTSPEPSPAGGYPLSLTLTPEDATAISQGLYFSDKSRSTLTPGSAQFKGFGNGSTVKSLSSGSVLSPAEHLRIQREKERERACMMAGIGTGLGGRNLGRGLKGQSTNPLIARFGLTAPPPPLPSASLASHGNTLGSKSAPSSPYEAPSSSVYPAQPHADEGKSLSDRSRSPRASSLQRTPNEERAMLRSMALSNRAVVAALDDSETECDEPKISKSGNATSSSPAVLRGRTANRSHESDGLGPSTPLAKRNGGLPNLVTTSPSPPLSEKSSVHPSGSSSSPLASSLLETPISGDADTPLWSASSSSSLSRTSDSYFHHRPARHRDEQVKRLSFPEAQQNSTNTSPHGSSPNTPQYGGSSSPWNDARFMMDSGLRHGRDRGGYDSPGSGFESGSEYDLIG